MTATITDLQTDLTQKVILDAAVRLLEKSSVGEVTARAVAREAGLSERTIFRYFATREEFLDAIAAEVTRTLSMPPHPRSIDELYAMPRALYACFESRTKLVKAAMHSEVFSRIYGGVAYQRWLAVRKLIDQHAPRANESARKIAAANIRYFLSATSWHYYRFVFRFNLEETVLCVETAIRQSVGALRK